MTAAKRSSLSDAYPRKALDNLVGQRFGKLLVLAEGPRFLASHPQRRVWICACDCMGFTVRETGRLKSGQVTSCGCKTDKQEVSKRAKEWQAKKAREKGEFQNTENPLNYFFGKKQ